MNSVLGPDERYRVVQSDVIEFLRGLPADSVDLIFTSPPYLAARTYGIGADIKCEEEWTAWMVEVVTECVRVCKGLTAVVCEGQTRNFCYLPAPFLLMADLHRKGFSLRKPCVYERDGIPGSGGPDWLKNRWEPIICIGGRPGKLPWSDNCALGKPPKCDPGGWPSNRESDGSRQNRRPYAPPEKANPGNIIDCGADTIFGFGNHSEAPFPLKLAEFFVRSFCQPDGVVVDPFCGSSTTGHAAIEHNRRYIGNDVRQSQVDLSIHRLERVTPSMFSEAS